MDYKIKVTFADGSRRVLNVRVGKSEQAAGDSSGL